MIIKKHKFKNKTGNIKISFDKNVYLNATEIYKEFDKSKSAFDNWKTRTLIPYATKLLDSKLLIGPQIVDLSDLIIVKKGKNVGGTWLHPKLAIVFARWISTEFEIWCDVKIAELLLKGSVSATAKERSKWNDLIPELLKKLSTHGYWSKQFKAVVESIEEETMNVRMHQKFIIQCSEHIMKQDRLAMYKKMISYYRDLMELGSIERRTWEDVTVFLFTQVGSVQTRRHNKVDKELDRLIFDNKALKLKLSILTDAEVSVPLSIKILKLNSLEDIKDVVKSLTVLNAKILYNGFMSSNTDAGKLTASGTKYPDYVSDVMSFNPFNVAIWDNTDDTSYAVVERMFKKIQFNLHRVGTVHFGAKIKSLQIRQYCIFDPTSLATIIFEYKIKYDN